MLTIYMRINMSIKAKLGMAWYCGWWLVAGADARCGGSGAGIGPWYWVWAPRAWALGAKHWLRPA